MKHARTTVLVLTSLPFLIAARWYWQTHVSLWPCILFWVIALADDPLRWMDMGSRRKKFYGMAFVGAFSNAIATIANGGTMPVLGKIDVTSVWVPLTEATSVPYLCDIFWGASIGDFFILGGLLCLFGNWILEKNDLLSPELVAENKRMPGLGIG